MAEYDIAVIGGDKRTAYMVPFFKEIGYRVIGYKLCHIRDEDAVPDKMADSLKSCGVGGCDCRRNSY